MKTDTPFVPTIKDLAVISPSDLGGRQILDVKLGSFTDAFVVNDQGVVYTYNIGTSTASR